jgi:hypothetical protein
LGSCPGPERGRWEAALACATCLPRRNLPRCYLPRRRGTRVEPSTALRHPREDANWPATRPSLARHWPVTASGWPVRCGDWPVTRPSLARHARRVDRHIGRRTALTSGEPGLTSGKLATAPRPGPDRAAPASESCPWHSSAAPPPFQTTAESCRSPAAIWHLRCPRCLQGRVFVSNSWRELRMLNACPRCRVIFGRENGYFTAAMIVSYVIAVPFARVLFGLIWRGEGAPACCARGRVDSGAPA